MAERPALTDRLGVRLAVAFGATALAATAIVTVLALVATSSGIGELRAERRAGVTADVADALAVAYEEADGWDGADLLPAHTLAAAAGAVLVVTTADGTDLPVPDEIGTYQRRIGPGRDAVTPAPTAEPTSEPTSAPTDGPGPTTAPTEAPTGSGPRPSSGPTSRPTSGPGPAPSPTSGPTSGPGGPDEGVSSEGRFHGPAGIVSFVLAAAPAVEAELTAPVVVDGRTVGTARLLFVAAAGDDAESAFREAVTRNVLLAALLAGALALVATAVVAPRLTRPLRRLTTAVDQIAGGDHSARAHLPAAVGELGVLARSVDAMAADLERQERLRRALVADVAHELRTPLTILLGEIESLRDGITIPGDAELASLQEEVQRLARLVEDLDAIAAAEAAGFELARAPVDLAATTTAALAGLTSQMDDAGIQVDTTVRPVLVAGDARRLEQVVRNLLTNAAKFTPPGGTITVAVDAHGDEAVLEVTDDGAGIPPDEIPHVFERFWRGRNATTVSGSGVGLAVVAELVAAHGGRVVAGNAAGRGARFTVTLPRLDPADGAAPLAPQPEAGALSTQ